MKIICLPEDMLRLIFNYYINDTRDLIYIISSFSFLKIENEKYYDKFKFSSSYKETLCKFIQKNQTYYIKILLNKLDYIVSSKEFSDISKYSSSDIIKTIYKYNKKKLCLYDAIYQASITHNNDTLETLYFLL